MVTELHLSIIHICHGRSEDLAHKIELREQSDIGVSRAVANMSILSELTIPFIKKNGSFIYYKSSEIEEELKKAQNAIRILGRSPPKLSKYFLPGSNITRSFITVHKYKESPKNILV